MSSKLLVRGSCSSIEADLNNYEETISILDATHYVNPPWQNLVGKTIIINLPIKVDYKRLGRYNRLISRFPINSEGKRPIKYDLIPYPEVEFSINKNPQPYKPLILNKYLLSDPDIKITPEDRYLLGTDPTTGGELNLVGYMIVKTIKS